MRVLIKKIALIAGLLILGLLQSPKTFASDINNATTHHIFLSSQVKLSTNSDVKNNNEGNNNETNSDADTNQKFKIDGMISAMSGNNFVVSGQTIFIDSSQVESFNQKGILATGERVLVSGIIKNGVKFAESINAIGTGQGRFQLKTEDNNLSIGSSASPNIHINVQTEGSVKSAETFLEQILAWLKGVTSL